MPRATFFVLKHLQIPNKACEGLWFSTTLPQIAIFSFELIKVCLRHLQEISATRNIKLRLAIKFPIPYEWWSNALPPGQEKASNTQDMPGRRGGGGMLKLSFDWYILRRNFKKTLEGWSHLAVLWQIFSISINSQSTGFSVLPRSLCSYFCFTLATFFSVLASILFTGYVSYCGNLEKTSARN